MLPKDYLAYKLSGVFCTDYSDASGMLLMDVKNKCWSKEMMQICGVTEQQLPTLYESYDVVGDMKADVAAEFGFGSGVKVIAGAGDNAAAAVVPERWGMGCAISLLEHPAQFLSQAVLLVWMTTMRCIHSPMQTAIII